MLRIFNILKLAGCHSVNSKVSTNKCGLNVYLTAVSQRITHSQVLHLRKSNTQRRFAYDRYCTVVSADLPDSILCIQMTSSNITQVVPNTLPRYLPIQVFLPLNNVSQCQISFQRPVYAKFAC